MTIPRDKLMHFLTGAFGGFAVALVLRWAGFEPIHALAGGVLLGIVAGIGKEIYDMKHPENHTSEIADAVATVIGSVTGALISSGIIV